jgi:hypothetical protein
MPESSKHREKWCWDRKIFIIDKYICIFLQEILDSYNVYIYTHLLLQIYINLNIIHFVQCKVHTMSPVAYAAGVGYILQSFYDASMKQSETKRSLCIKTSLIFSSLVLVSELFFRSLFL